MAPVLAELARYRSRRLIGFLLLACVLLTALVALKSAMDTRPPSKSELSTAEAKAKIAASDSHVQADLIDCLANPVESLGKDKTAEDCREAILPHADGFLKRAPLDLSGTLEGNGAGLAGLLIAVLVVAASTFAGGDWGSGAMTTQLLAQPRRLRLWWAKAGAVAIASAVVTLVCLAVFWSILYAVAAARDLAPSSGVVFDLVQQALRAAVLAAAAAVGAFSLTAAFRSTIGTLSLCFAFGMIGELLVALPFEGASRWSLGNNANGWLQKSFEFKNPSACSRAGDCDPLQQLAHWQSGLFLLVLLLIAIAVGVNMFRRTDA